MFVAAQINAGGIGDNNYSTEERIVGTWIDGKPIYKRTFTGTVSGTQTGLSGITASSVSKLLRVEGYVQKNNWGGYAIGSYISGQAYGGVFINYGTGVLDLYSPSTVVGGTYDVTLYYTKTTD